MYYLLAFLDQGFKDQPCMVEMQNNYFEEGPRHILLNIGHPLFSFKAHFLVFNLSVFACHGPSTGFEAG